MLINSQAQPFRKVRSVNETTTGGYRADNSLATLPSGDAATATGASYITLAPVQGGEMRGSVLIKPYGVGNEDTTFKMRLLKWDVAEEFAADPTKRIWLSTLLCDVTCTLCANVGIAGKALVASEREVDTIVLNGTGGNANVTVFIVSPTGDANATLAVSTLGAQILEWQFDRDGSATSANAFYKYL